MISVCQKNHLPSMKMNLQNINNFWTKIDPLVTNEQILAFLRCSSRLRLRSLSLAGHQFKSQGSDPFVEQVEEILSENYFIETIRVRGNSFPSITNRNKYLKKQQRFKTIKVANQ